MMNTPEHGGSLTTFIVNAVNRSITCAQKELQGLPRFQRQLKS